MIYIEERLSRSHPAFTRLADILRHDRVTVAGSDVCGTVLYVDDRYAVVRVDDGFEETYQVGELRLVGH